MTQITRDDVLHLAQLTRLQLGDDEIDSLAIDLTNILGYVKQLDELDTSGVEPTYQVSGLEAKGRDDDVIHTIGRDQLLSLAPYVSNMQVRVQKVL